MMAGLTPAKFTAGMTLVDSLDSVLMLYAYAAPQPGSDMLKMMFFIEPPPESSPSETPTSALVSHNEETADEAMDVKAMMPVDSVQADATQVLDSSQVPGASHTAETPSTFISRKAQTISSLSIILTVLSILVAFRFVRSG